MSASRRPCFRPMQREGNTVRIEGVPQAFQVVDQAAAEQAEYVVCMRLAGNERNRGLVAETVLGFCSLCKEPIYWSATTPKTPPRVCLVCFEADQARRASESGDGEPPVGGVTEVTLAECARAEKIMQRRAATAAQSLATLLTMPIPTPGKRTN